MKSSARETFKLPATSSWPSPATATEQLPVACDIGSNRLEQLPAAGARQKMQLSRDPRRQYA